MAALMNPVPDMEERQDTLQSLLLSPKAPRIDNPTHDEQARLDGYWMGVAKHLNTVLEIRRSWPGWLPEFNYPPMAT